MRSRDVIPSESNLVVIKNTWKLWHDKKMVVLVVYAYHEPCDSVTFFEKNGLIPKHGVHYYMIQNQLTVPLCEEGKEKASRFSYVTYLKRGNAGRDWGAYSAALRHWRERHGGKEPIDAAIFLNSTVMGPFVPPAYSDQHWTGAFLKRLTDDVAMVGSSINYHSGQPHVQSMAMALDSRALKLAEERELLWFHPNHPDPEKQDLIDKHEVGLSRLILDSGYNLDCLMKALSDQDWRSVNEVQRNKFSHHDPWGDERSWGCTLHPYETMFVKLNRPWSPAVKFALDQLRAWHMDEHPDQVEYWQKPNRHKTYIYTIVALALFVMILGVMLM